jgi:hypothetical protein
MLSTVTAAAPVVLVPRPVAGSLEELLAGATGRERFVAEDSKSGAPFERVVIGGDPHVVKYLHVDDDWISRSYGDLRCRPLTVWRSGLLDWAGPGAGPALQDLCWYLAINRARLPESKENAVAAFRASLEAHGVTTAEWWDRQLALCFVAATLQFGWEKALGDADEFGWWCDRALEGAALL